MVKDIHPGTSGSDPRELTAFGGRVWFAAHGSEADIELWSSDGTAAGTTRLVDLAPGPIGANPVALKAWGGLFYFSARTSATTLDYLWVTDGTAAGTRPFAYDSYLVHTLARDFVEYQGKLVFGARARHGIYVHDLIYETDGTASGTRGLVNDYRRRDPHTLRSPILPMGGELYYVSRHGADAPVLLRYAGVGKPPDIIVSHVNRDPGLAVTSTRLVFSVQDQNAGTEPWVSDGTVAGSGLLADLSPRNPALTVSAFHDLGFMPGGLHVLDDRVSFLTVTFSPQRVTWWRSDGTREGTVPTTEQPARTAIQLYRGHVYSAREDAAHGLELWRSDGTPSGTTLVKDIRPGPEGSNPSGLHTDENNEVRFLEAGGLLYFWANDGTHGGELWRTDGTGTGTQMVVNHAPGAESAPVIDSAVFGDQLLFTSWRPDQTRTIYRTDGSASGTRQVFAFDSTASPGPGMTCHAGKAYFTVASQAHGIEPWVTDGTTAGTMLLADIVAGPGDSHAGTYRVVGDHVVFSATDGPDRHGAELWRTDGTPAGTTLLKDIAPGPRDSYRIVRSYPSDREMVRHGEHLYFTAHGVAGDELWRTDGTAAGTSLAVDLEPFGSSSPRHLRSIGTRYLWFTAWTQANGREIWISDGTQGGTQRLTDVAPGSKDSVPGEFVRLRNRFFFFADDPVAGYEPFAIADPHAITDEFGSGCRRNAPAPHLSGDDPVQGRAISLRIDAGPASAAGLLLAGPPLLGGYFGGGCTLLVDMTGGALAMPFTTDATGRAVLAGIQIPIHAGLVGVTLTVQAGMTDSPTGPIGIALTNALGLTLGDR